jgi:DNA-binding NtrC family response regulator
MTLSSLFESEFFEHVKGAFAGATQDKNTTQRYLGEIQKPNF